MEEPPYALSTLNNTDAHSGGVVSGVVGGGVEASAALYGVHTCRRLSWPDHALDHNHPVTTAQPYNTNNLDALSATYSLGVRRPSYRLSCEHHSAAAAAAAAAAAPILVSGSAGNADDDDPEEDEELIPESVDLLRMLPETQRPKEINPRRTRCAYLARDAVTDDDESDLPPSAPLSGGSVGGSGGGGVGPPGSGVCDDGVLFYNSLRCASEYTAREQQQQEERIAFLSRSYSTLDKTNKPLRNNNNTTATTTNSTTAANSCSVYSDVEHGRASSVAEYCTSKAHSRSCGSLTYPAPQRTDAKRLNRSSRNIYADSSGGGGAVGGGASGGAGGGSTGIVGKGLKHKRLKRLRRCVFLAAIFLGIVLATTGIIVAFLVYAPFHMKAHSCRNGYVFCGKTGCVTPRRLCGSRLECPGINTEFLCRGNKSDHSKDFIYSEGLPVTLNPLLREGTLLFGKATTDATTTVTPDPWNTTDVSGWVYFQGGSTNGSRYITVHRAMTYYGAQESCRDQGGHLAHINTVREQVFLEDYLNQIYKRHRFPSDMLGFWVGGRRARGSHAGSCLYNQWQWMDTYGRAHGTVTGFTAFSTGKPDNFFAPEECLYLSTTHSQDEARYLKWDDAPCDIHGIGTIYAVCEVELR